MGEGSTETPQGVGRGPVEHVPVLLKQAIDFLAVRRGGTYIDCTVGLGGHSYEIAKRLGAPGHLIGFDKDPKALEIADEKLKGVVGRSSSVVGQNTSEIHVVRCTSHPAALYPDKCSCDQIARSFSAPL